MKKLLRKTLCAVLVFTLLFSLTTVKTMAASKAKNACAAALKVTKNIDKIQYQSTSAQDFEGIPFNYKNKVTDMYFVTSDNGVYNVCIAKAKTTKVAKKLNTAFKKFKNNQINGLYFESDYSKEEQTIMKNAVYGRKGKFVWYVSMSDKKTNMSAVKKLKKKL